MIYYNDNDPFCCAWLRELIAAGHLPEGKVDERSITEIQPDEIAGCDQWHFFAGTGAWKTAIDAAGLGTTRSVLTGSCPCPPFSVAGRKKTCPACQEPDLIAHPFRTGFFVCAACGHEWFADGRHLWPEMLRLIRGLNPRVVLGEQVAGEDGEYWLAGVRGSLEMEGYATDAASLNAAGVGAGHIRQRLFWGAVRSDDAAARSWRQQAGRESPQPRGSSETDRGAYAEHAIGRAEREIDGEAHGRDGSGGSGATDRHGDTIEPRLEGYAEDGSDRDQPGRIDATSQRSTPPSDPWSRFRIVPFGGGKAIRIPEAQPWLQSLVDVGVSPCAELADLWDASGGDPLYPLASWPIKGRTGILRGAGNAIVPALAAEFVKTFLEV